MHQLSRNIKKRKKKKRRNVGSLCCSFSFNSHKAHFLYLCFGYIFNLITKLSKLSFWSLYSPNLLSFWSVLLYHLQKNNILKLAVLQSIYICGTLCIQSHLSKDAYDVLEPSEVLLIIDSVNHFSTLARSCLQLTP